MRDLQFDTKRARPLLPAEEGNTVSHLRNAPPLTCSTSTTVSRQAKSTSSCRKARAFLPDASTKEEKTRFCAADASRWLATSQTDTTSWIATPAMNSSEARAGSTSEPTPLSGAQITVRMGNGKYKPSNQFLALGNIPVSGRVSSLLHPGIPHFTALHFGVSRCSRPMIIRRFSPGVRGCSRKGPPYAPRGACAKPRDCGQEHG